MVRALGPNPRARLGPDRVFFFGARVRDELQVQLSHFVGKGQGSGLSLWVVLTLTITIIPNIFTTLIQTLP